MVATRGAGWRESEEGKYVVTEEDWALGGEHTPQHRDDVIERTLGTYIMLFINVNPINFIIKKEGIKEVFSLPYITESSISMTLIGYQCQADNVEHVITDSLSALFSF